MSVTMEPRKVAPKALIRWVISAGDLLGRNVHVWVLLVAAVCGAAYLLQGYVLAEQAVAGFLLVLGIDVAAALDSKSERSWVDVLKSVRKGLPSAIFWVSLYIALPLINTALNQFMAGQEFSRDLVFLPPSTGNLSLLRAIGEAMSVGLAQMGVAVIFVGLFCHPLRRLGRIPNWRAFWLGHNGEWMNLGPCMTISLSLTLVAPVVAVYLPWALPLVFCFYSVLVYVGWRDIYMGIAENRSLATTANQVSFAAS